MPSPPWRSLLALEVLFVLTWNSGFIGAEYGLPYASTFTLLLWRYLILTGLIAMALIVRGRLALARRLGRDPRGSGGRAGPRWLAGLRAFGPADGRSRWH